VNRACIRVLLAEDNHEDSLITIKLLHDSLRAVFDVKWVSTYEAALAALQTPFDVCLVDYRLGLESGVALIKQATVEGFRGPMILLTGLGDHDVDIEAMKVGAADYLVKGQITPQLMERVIRHSIERKTAETALRRSEEQLRQSQKMEAVGNLAGGLAHDFNNLLSVILSYSELLANDLKAGDPMRADLIDINDAGLRAADLTRQLLAFSRQQVLQPRIMNLNDVFVGMEKMLRRVIGEDVQLLNLADPEPCKIVADPGQMEQILMNLAVNARDAMPQGGTLTIETSTVMLSESDTTEHVGAKAGLNVMLVVSDTGVGMDQATLMRIFEPFFTTKAVGKGTGLGLSTVFGIVKQSGGAISACSAIGKGTSFTTYFPAADASATAPSGFPPVLIEPHNLRGSETVLVVEDEERVRVLVRTILRKYGYQVLEARSGGDALMVCEQHPALIDLLLTDVVMPHISGTQLAARLLAVRPEMKVLFMSGYTGSLLVKQDMHGSGAAFLQKPITPDALGRGVREVLRSSRGRGAGPVA
jgi:two-component system, cell cycle sensor histidine kinase and response regulator CckA